MDRTAERGKASCREQHSQALEARASENIREAAQILQRSVQTPQVAKTVGLQVARKEREEEKVEGPRPQQPAKLPPSSPPRQPQLAPPSTAGSWARAATER